MAPFFRDWAGFKPWGRRQRGRDLTLRMAAETRAKPCNKAPEGGVNGEVIKRVGDAKLFRVSEQGAMMEALPKNLAKTGDWAIKWLMKFNLDKHRLMLLGGK